MTAVCPKLKVLLISPLAPPVGGIGIWTATVLSETANNDSVGIRVVDTAVRWRAIDNLHPVVRVIGGSLQGVRDLWRTWKAIRQFKPDVMHINTSAGPATVRDLAMVSLAARHGVKTVVHYHMGRLPEIIKSDSREWKLLRSVMLKTDRVVALGGKAEQAVNSTLQMPKAVAIPTPVNISQIEELVAAGGTAQAADDVPHIVFVGHVVAKKGVAELIKACCRLESRDFVLDIVGPVNEKYKSELQALAASHKNGTWLVFHGTVNMEAVIKFISNGTIFVLASTNNMEAFPKVIIEAMACGIPVIASDVGAISEMLDICGDPCGICVEPCDVDGLGNAIRTLLDDPLKRSQLAQRAKIRAHDYSSSDVVAELCALWKSLIQETS